MKKFLFLSMMLGTAMMASAQTAEEEIMKLLPKMPTETEMIRYHKEKNSPSSENITVAQPYLYGNFHNALKNARDKADKKIKEVGETSRARAMKSKAAGTDYTVEEIENMSEAEQEKMAMAMAQKKLAGMGLNLSDLPSDGRKLSDAQAKALAGKVMAKAKSGQLQETNPKQAELMLKLQELSTEEFQRVTTIDDPLKTAAQKGRQLYARDYKDRIDALVAQQKALKYVFMEKYTEEDKPKVEAETKKYNELAVQIWEIENEFYAKYIPMWYRAVQASMDFCKNTLIPIEKRRQSVTKELYDLTQDTNYTMGDTYPLVGAASYLDQAGKLGEYDDFLKLNGEE
jgi:hypothetical protein